MEIILATWNKSKVEWLINGFSHLGLKITSINKDVIDDVEEYGKTSTENALIKIRAIGIKKNSIIIGEDSILSVDALDGFPGVRTVRWADGTDDDRSAKLLEKLKDIPDGKRGAKFQSAIALLFPDGVEKTFIGELFGKISHELIGEMGQGYQRIFLLPRGKLFSKSASPFTKIEDHRDKSIKIAVNSIHKWLKVNND